MSEILGILIQILFILIIFSFPIIVFEAGNKSGIFKFSLIDKISINLIIFINILLFASILNINSKYILYLYSLLIIFFYFYNFKKINFRNLKINYHFITLLFFIILISIDIAHELYFGWDTKKMWFFKTLNFYQDQKFDNLKNLPVSDYPHLGPYIWSFFWKYPFNSNEYFGRLFYGFIYVLSIFSITECLKSHIYEKIIFAILLIFLTYNYELFSGLQEVLVFSFILIATKFAYYFFQNKIGIKILELIYILLGITIILFWIKHESLFFILFLLFCILITSKLDAKSKTILVIGSLTIFFIKVFIFYFYETKFHYGAYEFEKTLNFSFFEIIKKIKTISFYIVIYLTQNPIYFLTLPVLFYISFKYKLKNITKFILYFLILNFAFVYIVYLFKVEEVEMYIRTTMKRVLFETSGFYFLAIIILINNYAQMMKNKFSKNFF